MYCYVIDINIVYDNFASNEASNVTFICTSNQGANNL
jgi:hypothetical protein